MVKKTDKIILSISFFLSGVAGLIYEVLWAKYLVLIFGNNTYAHSLVLATFMGGLALGSFWGGRLADTAPRKLYLYAWLQFGIGLYCFFTPAFFSFSKYIYIGAAKTFLVNSVSLIALKFLIGIVIMLPPTICMGMTFPLLSKLMIDVLAKRGEIIARLYFINNLGAVLGTFIAGFYLVHAWGLAFSVSIAAGINFCAGIMALILARFRYLESSSGMSGDAIREDKKIRAKEERDSEKIFSSAAARIALSGIFLSGFAAMVYEVVWIRLLSLILGSSTYSFSLMLAAFISGITIGAYVISRYMPKTAHTVLWFAMCEIAIAFSLMCTLPFYEKLPVLFGTLSNIFSRQPKTFVLYSGMKFFISFLVMLPPTVCLGMTLPLVTKIVSSYQESLGRKIGGVFGYNTLGNILGALIAGLILIPLLGLKGTLELGLVISFFIGAGVLLVDKTYALKYKLFLIMVCCLIFAGYKTFIPEWNKGYFHAQVFRLNNTAVKMVNTMAKTLAQKENVIYYKDGLNDSVAVLKLAGDLVLFVNGKADASSGIDAVTQVTSAQIPLLLKPNAQEALIVGMGSGMTAGSALVHPLKRLDVIEISPDVIEASKCFAQYNYKPWEDGRFHLYLEDAKTFLQRTERKYDVIISEPSNPWMSGLGAVFSEEFFSDCRSHLNNQGIMLQWIQGYETNDEIFEIVLRTFSSVFPRVIIWGTGTKDLFLIGSVEGINVDFQAIERAMNNPPVKKDLERVGINDLFTLLSLQIASDEQVKLIMAENGIKNSDYFPVLEYRAPVALYMRSDLNEFLARVDERNMPAALSSLFIKDYIVRYGVRQEALNNLYRYLVNHHDFNKVLFQAVIKRRHEQNLQDKEALAVYMDSDAGKAECRLAELERIMGPDIDPVFLDMYTALLWERYKTVRSFLCPEIVVETTDKLMKCMSKARRDKEKFYFLLGTIAGDNKAYEKAIRLYDYAEKVIGSEKDIGLREQKLLRLLENKAYAYFYLGVEDKVLECLNRMQKIDPGSEVVYRMIRQLQIK